MRERGFLWVPIVVCSIFAVASAVCVDSAAHIDLEPVAGFEIVGVSPAQGRVTGGTGIIITGNGFDPAYGVTVLFGDVAAEVLWISETQIACMTPPQDGGGVVDVTVVQQEVGSDTMAAGFTYAEPDIVLSVADVVAMPGNNVKVVVSLTNTGEPIAAAVTFTLLYDTTVLVPVDDMEPGFPGWQIADTGSAAYDAGKNVLSNVQDVEIGAVTVVIAGLDVGAIGDGEVAVLYFTVSDTADSGRFPLEFISNAMPYSGPCDVNSDGLIDAVDVQLVINAARGVSKGLHCDIDGSGSVNAVDVQLAINAAAGINVGYPVWSFSAADQSAERVVIDGTGALVRVGGIAPAITSIHPTAGPITGGTDVTIYGSGFNASAVVYFGWPAEATSTELVSSTQLQTVTPAHDPGTVDVMVSQNGGADTLEDAFTYVTQTYSISGTVTLGVSKTVSVVPSGVTVMLSGDAVRSTVTDAMGKYGFSGLAPGNYTVTPTLEGYEFTPTHRSYEPLSEDQTGQDFVGQPTGPLHIAVTAIEPADGIETGGTQVEVYGNYFPSLDAAQLELGGAVATVTHVYDSGQAGSRMVAVTSAWPADVDTAVDVTVTDLTTSASGTLARGFTYIAVRPAPPQVDELPAFIDADSIVVTGTADAGAFVTVGGGLYPTCQQLADDETQFSIPVDLKQNAVNGISVAVIDEFGLVSPSVTATVVERDSLPDTGATPSRLTVGPAMTGVAVGESIQFNCTAEFPDGSTGDVTQFVDWSVTGGDCITTHGLYINTSDGPAEVRASADQVTSPPVIVTDLTAKAALRPAVGLGMGFVAGVVTDTYTGLGIEGAQTAARVAGQTQVANRVETNQYGNYFMTLFEDVYDMEASAPDRVAETVYNCELPGGALLTQSFALSPVDGTPPEVNIIEPEPDDVVQGTQVGITARIYDQYSAIDRAVLVVNGQDETDVTQEITAQGYFRAKVRVPAGNATVRIEAEDTAGNPLVSDQVSFKVETLCDVNGTGDVDAIDVQLVINRALGLHVEHNCDVNGDKIVNAIDVQLVINAALGIGT